MGSKAGRKSRVQPAEARTISGSNPTAQPGLDAYLALVIQFPLVPIRDDGHLAKASAVLDQLLQQDLDGGQRDYLEVLTDLVEKYEEEHVRIPDASELDVLRELMRSHGLSQHALRARTGIAQSTISAVLNGERSITKQQVITLAGYFGVATSAFMPVQPRDGSDERLPPRGAPRYRKSRASGGPLSDRSGGCSVERWVIDVEENRLAATAESGRRGNRAASPA